MVRTYFYYFKFLKKILLLLFIKELLNDYKSLMREIEIGNLFLN